MKKSTILILLSAFILWIVYLVLTPLEGKVYLDSNSNKPRDIVSAFVQSFDQSDKIEKLNLTDIKHLKFISGEKYIQVNIDNADTAKVNVSYDGQLSNFQYKVNQDSLIISLRKDSYGLLELSLDSNKNYSLTLEKTFGRIYLTPAVVDKKGLNKITIQDHSDVAIQAANSRENQNIKQPFEIDVSQKSKVELEYINFYSLKLNANNALFTLSESSGIDSLNADLQGLSNIIVGKYPEDKRVKSLVLSGNLDYYNSRKPK